MSASQRTLRRAATIVKQGSLQRAATRSAGESCVFQARRNLSQSCHTPKHEIRSRPAAQLHARLPIRTFSSSPRQCYKTVQEAKSRYRLGPFSWQAGLLFLLAGAGLTVYFRYEKERMNRKRIAEHSKGMGRPLVGGPFSLTDHNGKPFTNEDMKGKYALVYFGFTHCPDICPEELDKMAGMIDRVKEKHGNVLLPVFITCDPARDTPEVTKEYLKEFHPDIIGLTGTYEQVKHVCKQYRVYFSTPKDVKPGEDYLVDHSIYFYLMGEWLGGSAIWDVRLGASKADAIQIPMVILSKLSDAISPSKRRPRSSTTMFRTGGEDR
ncbi:Cu-binding protein [Taxawa tesnikishii (nom. ined.)]|nr:Cu-binding protein [Dothideales sp. JES 119]